MLKRTFIALLFAALSATIASAQTATELMFSQVAAGGTEITQRAAILPLPPPPPGSAQRPELANVPQAALPIAVAVENYLLGHGYLQNGPYGISVTRTDGGWVIQVTTPGGNNDFFVHAPGPTFPVPTDNTLRVLVSALAVRYDISNGF